MARLGALAGVREVAVMAAGSPPLASAGFIGTGTGMEARLRAAGERTSAEWLACEFRYVSSGYFEAAGIPIEAGTVFDDGAADRQAAIVVDARAAATLFGASGAVGRDVTDGGGLVGTRRIAAVARHVRLDGPERSSPPQVYLPLGAAPPSLRSSRTSFLIRTDASSALSVPAIRTVLQTDSVRLPEVRLLDDAFRNITADRRFSAGLLSLLGALAALIGVAGVYSTMASVVVQQMRDMGIRAALGATPWRVERSVLAQAGQYLASGVILGLIGASWLSRSVASLLYGIQPADPTTYAAVAVVVVAAGLLAAWLPARRAGRADILAIVRSE